MPANWPSGTLWPRGEGTRRRSRASRLLRCSSGNRTRMAKRFWASKTVVATRPPTAVSIRRFTSAVLTLCRAIASRSICTSICVNPETCSILTFLAPLTAERIGAIRSPVARSVSISFPKILIATSDLIPLINSLTRNTIGWEKAGRIPGNADNSRSIASTRSALERPVFHSRRGLSMMNRSLCSGPMGSSAISARPVLDTTVVISGNFANRRFSISVHCKAEPSTLAEGRRTTLTAIAPSSSGGRNSVPIRGSTENAPTMIAAATAMVIHRPRIATERTGR